MEEIRWLQLLVYLQLDVTFLTLEHSLLLAANDSSGSIKYCNLEHLFQFSQRTKKMISVVMNEDHSLPALMLTHVTGFPQCRCVLSGARLLLAPHAISCNKRAVWGDELWDSWCLLVIPACWGILPMSDLREGSLRILTHPSTSASYPCVCNGKWNKE